jgi:hypothetical protein
VVVPHGSSVFGGYNVHSFFTVVLLKSLLEGLPVALLEVALQYRPVNKLTFFHDRGVTVRSTGGTVEVPESDDKGVTLSVVPGEGSWSCKVSDLFAIVGGDRTVVFWSFGCLWLSFSPRHEGVLYGFSLFVCFVITHPVGDGGNCRKVSSGELFLQALLKPCFHWTLTC